MQYIYLTAIILNAIIHDTFTKMKISKYTLLSIFILSLGFVHSQTHKDTLFVTPNPFNKSTTICFEVASKDTITLSIIDVLGRHVRTYYNDTIIAAGKYYVDFLRDTLIDGIYFVNIQHGKRKKNTIKVAVISSSEEGKKNSKKSNQNTLPQNLESLVLKYIPDYNLRNELRLQGFTTNDSLDTKKIEGRLQLELIGKGIENLDGLQYFKQVWRLIINNNKIKNISHLPPNLTVLDCSNNEISRIDSLPEHLDYLGCVNNNINYIDKLPNSLSHFLCANNKMTQLPTLPKNIIWVNFANNPISIDSLPHQYRSKPCTDITQNCLPYELIDWKILNVNTRDTAINITGMQINIHGSYSWGFGSQLETIYFKINKTKTLRSKIRNIRFKDNLKPDTSYLLNKIPHSFETKKLKEILSDIVRNNLNVKFKIGDTLKTINLNRLNNGNSPCSSSCMDCSFYSITYTIYTDKDTIKLGYGFYSDLGNGVDLCADATQDIKSLANYLYILKLIYLTIPDHEIARDPELKVQNNIDKIYRWTR